MIEEKTLDSSKVWCYLKFIFYFVHFYVNVFERDVFIIIKHFFCYKFSKVSSSVYLLQNSGFGDHES